MNIKQLRTIECLTNQMLREAPYSARANLIFTVKEFLSGYMVECMSDIHQAHWTDTDFQAMAYIGPRGGIKNYRILSSAKQPLPN